MTKSIVKEDRHILENKGGSPIHLHISEDAPIHLHFDQDYGKRMHPTASPGKYKREASSYQTHWVPPPAKTSSGKSNRRVRLQPTRRSGSLASLQSDPESTNALPEVTSTWDNERNLEHKSDQKYVDRSRSAQPVHRNVSLEETGPLGDLGKTQDSSIEDKALSITDERIRDIEKSTRRLSSAARNLDNCFEQILIEGKRLTSRDVGCLNQPRDDLVQHAEVIARAARDLCRRTTEAQQQDRYMKWKPIETVTKDDKLESEVRLLTRRLDNTMMDLEETRRRLHEQQSERVKSNTVNESLESLKGHLQRELRQRESECSRLSTQVRNLESRLSEERATLKTRLDAAEANVTKLLATKEALKRAARAQKRRADQAEEHLTKTLERLATKDVMSRYVQIQQEEDDRAGVHETNDGRRSRIAEEYSDESRPDSSVPRPTIVRDPRQRNISAAYSGPQASSSGFRLEQENAHLRDAALSCEQRLRAAEHEIDQLRTSLAQCEQTMRDYHGDAEIQTERVCTLNEKLREAESERKRTRDQLSEMEQRLIEAEAQNRALISAMEAGSNLGTQGILTSSVHGTQPRPKASEGQGDVSSKSQLPIPMLFGEATSDVTQPTVVKATESKTPYCTSSPLLDELRRQLTETRLEKEQAERRAEARLADLRAQLNQADATNRSLQAYLTFLKRSYASVFQPDMAPLFDGIHTTYPTTTTTGFHMKIGQQLDYSHHPEMESPNMSGLSPQPLPTDKHR